LYASADSTKKIAMSSGVRDAFIVAYKGGNRTLLNRSSMMSKEEASTLPAKLSVSASAAKSEPVTTSSELPSGTIYKVQIGAFRQKPSQRSLDNFQRISSNTISNETTASGLQLYYSGSFTDLNSALFAKNLIAANGIKDAFVVAFSNGKKVPVSQPKVSFKK
jgi:hypothetical protein